MGTIDVQCKNFCLFSRVEFCKVIRVCVLFYYSIILFCEWTRSWANSHRKSLQCRLMGLIDMFVVSLLSVCCQRLSCRVSDFSFSLIALHDAVSIFHFFRLRRRHPKSRANVVFRVRSSVTFIFLRLELKTYRYEYSYRYRYILRVNIFTRKKLKNGGVKRKPTERTRQMDKFGIWWDIMRVTPHEVGVKFESNNMIG